jgi:hypothetical protein
MYIHNFLRRFLESDEDDVSKCLLEAFEVDCQQPTATTDQPTFQVNHPIWLVDNQQSVENQ